MDSQWSLGDTAMIDDSQWQWGNEGLDLEIPPKNILKMGRDDRCQ